ncbi:MAG: hypothetical protein ACOC8B_03890, partial [Gemmatimonadota bacterium]
MSIASSTVNDGARASASGGAWALAGAAAKATNNAVGASLVAVVIIVSVRSGWQHPVQVQDRPAGRARNRAS